MNLAQNILAGVFSLLISRSLTNSKKAIRLDMIEGQLLVRIEGEMEDPERTKKKVEK